jgi:hypothetical protein
MSITPITASAPACYGVCCPQHGHCARYAAVDGMTGAHAIATCDDEGTGARPLFRQMQQGQATPHRQGAPA